MLPGTREPRPEIEKAEQKIKTLLRLIIDNCLLTFIFAYFDKENVAFFKVKFGNEVFRYSYGKLIIISYLPTLKLNNFRHIKHHLRLIQTTFKNSVSVFIRNIYKLLETLVTIEVKIGGIS